MFDWGYWFLRSYKRGTRRRNSVDESCQKGGAFSQKPKGLMPYNLMLLDRIGMLPQHRSECHGRLLGASATELETATSRKHSCNRLRNLIFQAHLEERSHGSSVTMRILSGIWLGLFNMFSFLGLLFLGVKEKEYFTLGALR